MANPIKSPTYIYIFAGSIVTFVDEPEETNPEEETYEGWALNYDSKP